MITKLIQLIKQKLEERRITKALKKRIKNLSKQEKFIYF